MEDKKVVKAREEVEGFLRDFMPKFDIWGIFFLFRDKNVEALKHLGITPKAREEVVRQITANDYVETVLEQLAFGDMWVFGKDFDGTPLYIKIAMGKPNSQTICISFHAAEHPINYAFKKE